MVRSNGLSFYLFQAMRETDFQSMVGKIGSMNMTSGE
jgi:hypothetical protein